MIPAPSKTWSLLLLLAVAVGGCAAAADDEAASDEGALTSASASEDAYCTREFAKWRGAHERLETLRVSEQAKKLLTDTSWNVAATVALTCLAEGHQSDIPGDVAEHALSTEKQRCADEHAQIEAQIAQIDALVDSDQKLMLARSAQTQLADQTAKCDDSIALYEQMQ